MNRNQNRRLIAPPTLGVAIVFIAIVSACAPQGVTDSADAIELYEKYRKAVLEKDGETAADCVTASTLELYGSWLELARNASRQELERESVMNMFVVVRLRSEYVRPEIEAISPRELFMIGVRKGWVSRSSVENVEIASVEIEGDGGKLFVSKESDVHFPVVREQDGWRLDLGPVMERAGPLMDAQAAEAEMTKPEFVELMYRSVSKEPLDPEVWKAPRESD